jgi:hypothetical protein
MRPARSIPAPVAAPAGRPVAAPPSRPTWFDFLLLPAGFAGSVLLGQLSGFRATRMAETPPGLPDWLVAILPLWLFLPVGPILLWPIFYLTQRLAGRSQALSWGEWLLGLAWLAGLVLAGGIIWQAWGTLPGFLAERLPRYLVLGHMLGGLSLGGLAVVLLLVDLAGRWPQPWTHRLSLGLLIWQLAPLALLWFGHIQLT